MKGPAAACSCLSRCCMYVGTSRWAGHWIAEHHMGQLPSTTPPSTNPGTTGGCKKLAARHLAPFFFNGKPLTGPVPCGHSRTQINPGRIGLAQPLSWTAPHHKQPPAHQTRTTGLPRAASSGGVLAEAPCPHPAAGPLGPHTSAPTARGAGSYMSSVVCKFPC